MQLDLEDPVVHAWYLNSGASPVLRGHVLERSGPSSFILCPMGSAAPCGVAMEDIPPGATGKIVVTDDPHLEGQERCPVFVDNGFGCSSYQWLTVSSIIDGYAEALPGATPPVPRVGYTVEGSVGPGLVMSICPFAPPVSGSGGGDHASLTHLDYASAGHTGFSPTVHVHAGTDITSGTIDGNRLPAMSAAKRGGVPATGAPAGLFLRDDGSFAAPAGGSAPLLKIPISLNESTNSVTPVLAGGMGFNKSLYTYTTIKFRAIGSVSNAAYTGTIKLYEDGALKATLNFTSTSPTISESAALSLSASEKCLEAQIYVDNALGTVVIAAAWLEITP